LIEHIRDIISFLLDFTITFLFVLFTGALILGAAFAAKDGDCTYDNYVKQYSGGYWIGCELFKTRWHHD